MVEVRKEICAICGWSRIIEVREEVKCKPPRIGWKEILVCKECQKLRGTPQFQEYYLIALRGTLYESGVVMARKKPRSPNDVFSPAPRPAPAPEGRALYLSATAAAKYSDEHGRLRRGIGAFGPQEAFHATALQTF